jgi:hypothetical protein
MSYPLVIRENYPATIRRRPFTMKRSAAQYAVLSPLLDEALRLDHAARGVWLAKLPAVYASYRPALDRILTMDSARSQRHLNGLELRLRAFFSF